MAQVLLFLSFMLVLTVQAEETMHTCNDPEVIHEWEKALNEYPKDRLILKLYVIRRGLCEMVKEGKIDVGAASSMWDLGLMDALLERPREKKEMRGLLRLFGTF